MLKLRKNKAWLLARAFAQENEDTRKDLQESERCLIITLRARIVTEAFSTHLLYP